MALSLSAPIGDQQHAKDGEQETNWQPNVESHLFSYRKTMFSKAVAASTTTASTTGR